MRKAGYRLFPVGSIKFLNSNVTDVDVGEASQIYGKAVGVGTRNIKRFDPAFGAKDMLRIVSIKLVDI